MAPRPEARKEEGHGGTPRATPDRRALAANCRRFKRLTKACAAVDLARSGGYTGAVRSALARCSGPCPRCRGERLTPLIVHSFRLDVNRDG